MYIRTSMQLYRFVCIVVCACQRQCYRRQQQERRKFAQLKTQVDFMQIFSQPVKNTHSKIFPAIEAMNLHKQF